MKGRLTITITLRLFLGFTGLLYAYFSDNNVALAGEGTIFNDATTNLNSVKVYKVVKVRDVKDISQALEEAKSKGLKISIAGRRHAQGGQQSYPNCIVLDMMDFNKIISLDKKNKIIRVQSGITWKQVQNYIQPYGYAVRVMQVFDIFTVGGSLSSNVHGDDPNYGSIIESVKSFHLMLADGRVINVSRQENPELFSLVIGGYGLFGIIIDVDLLLTDNVVYKKNVVFMDYTRYPEFLQSNILNDAQIGEHYAVLLKSRRHARTLKVTTYSRVLGANETLANFFAKEGKGYVFRIDYTARALSFVASKDLIQEYFVPVNKFVLFIDSLRGILKSFREISESGHVIAPSIRVRYIKEDKQSFLPYAKVNSLAVSVDIVIGESLSGQGLKDIQNLTRRIVALSLGCGGTFYLTKIAVYPNREQLLKAYPEFDKFIKKKERYDPQGIFMNQFYDHYRQP